MTRKLKEVNPVPRNLSMSPISGRGKRKIPAIPLSFCHGNPRKMWRIFSFHRRDKQHFKNPIRSKSIKIIPIAKHLPLPSSRSISNYGTNNQVSRSGQQSSTATNTSHASFSRASFCPTSCSCSPLTCCEEKIWHAAPWSLAVSTISTYLSAPGCWWSGGMASHGEISWPNNFKH